eukprot:6498763-Pyramimonas_sp.AAC.2
MVNMLPSVTHMTCESTAVLNSGLGRNLCIPRLIPEFQVLTENRPRGCYFGTISWQLNPDPLQRALTATASSTLGSHR